MENGTKDTNQVEDPEVAIPNFPNRVIDINAIQYHQVEQFTEAELYHKLKHKMQNSQIKKIAILKTLTGKGKRLKMQVQKWKKT